VVSSFQFPAEVSYFDMSTESLVNAENKVHAKAADWNEFLVMMDSGLQNLPHELYDVDHEDDKQDSSLTSAKRSNDTHIMENPLKKLIT
jgi:hypothetical protein